MAQVDGQPTTQNAVRDRKHDALPRAMDWGFAVALALVGLLVILGPSSPLSFPVAGEVVPRVVIAYLAAHSSLQWGAWLIDLSNALCAAVAPATVLNVSSSVGPGRSVSTRAGVS
jgi:hypothetical protein